MRNPRKLLERIDLMDDITGDFDLLIERLKEIRNQYPDRLIEIEYNFDGCQGHGEDEYCYCASSSYEVNVYDIDKDDVKQKKRR